MSRQASGILTIILILALAGCEIDTTISVDGMNPPSFQVSGSGGINFVRVVDVTNCNKAFLDCPILWRIEPTGGQVSIPDLPAVTYGQVPSGFYQTSPTNGAPLSELVEGKTYNVYPPTYNANRGGVRFRMVDGKSVDFR